MQVVVDPNAITDRFLAPDGRELIRWGKRYSPSPDLQLLRELEYAIERKQPLPFESAEEPGQFLIRYPRGEVVIYSDLGVPTSLNYASEDGVVHCATTDKAVSAMTRVSKTIDLAGVLQRLLFRFTIGPRTRYSGVSVAEPGTVVAVQNNHVHRTVLPYIDPGDVTLTDLYEALGEELRRVARQQGLGLMLSGGYDSRVLLALCDKLGIELECTYTHGPKTSREARLAAEMAREIGVRQAVHVDRGDRMFGTADELRRLFKNVGLLYQPFWRLAGEYFGTRSVVPMCGIQAETVNGQYLYGLRRGQSPRTRVSGHITAFRGYGAYIRSEAEFVDFCWNSVPHSLLSFVKEDIQASFRKTAFDVTRDDLQTVARRYRGVHRSWEEVFVRFLVDHEGAKSMAQQAEILRRHTPVCAPFLGRRVFSVCNKVPNNEKRSGEVMRRILRKWSPQLGRYGCPRSGLPATYPEVLHFMGRTVQSLADRRRLKHFLVTKGRGGSLPYQTAMGADVWLRDGHQLGELRALVNGSVLDMRVMNDWLDGIAQYRTAVGHGNHLLRLLELELLV